MTLDGAALNANSTTGYIGLIFYGLEDLEGATIDEAHLECYFTSGSFDDPDVSIYGNDTDITLTVFTTTSNQISGLTPTSAAVAWDAGSVGTGWENSPDIKTVIQEIIDRPGWSGDRITIVIKGATSGSLMRIRSYDGATTEAAKLVINYTVASPVTVELDTLGATAAAVSLAVVPGAVSILLDTLAHLLAAVDLTVVPGGVAVVLTALDLDAAAVDLAVVPGAVAVVLTTLDMDGAAVSFTVVPGAVDIPLDTLALLGTAVSLTVSVEGVDVTVVLATLAHSLSAVSLAVVPGAVTITLDTLAAVLAAIDLGVATDGTIVQVHYWPTGYWPTGYWPEGYWPEVESVIGSALIVQLMTLAATLTAVPLQVVPGDVAIELQTLAANLSLNELIVFLLLGCAATGDRVLFDAAAADFARYVAVAADRTGCA